MPGVFLCSDVKWEEKVREEGDVYVHICFSARDGLRQTKLIFISNKGWSLEEEDCGGKCMEEKYFKSNISNMCIIHGQSM